MKKATMLIYLEEQLEKHLADYEVGLDWDRKNHTIEVIVRLYAENNEQVTIDDVDGTISEEEFIEFEDGLLFYNPQKSVVDDEDYLVTIPYEGKKGLRKTVLDGFIHYLKVVLDERQSELLDFLSDETAEVFELHWVPADFEAVIKKVAETEKEQWIVYPSY